MMLDYKKDLSTQGFSYPLDFWIHSPVVLRAICSPFLILIVALWLSKIIFLHFRKYSHVLLNDRN